jgi:hypothetical protein
VAAADAVAVVAVADSAVFDVLDVFGGATQLVKPNATLDGSLHLRAARACSPLLDGNRFGFQVDLTQKLTLDKSLWGLHLTEIPDGFARTISGSMPRVLAEGLLDPRGTWARAFKEGIVFRDKKQRCQVSLFTGLFVKPRDGHWLRLGHAGNRRNLAFDVEEYWIIDSQKWTPLVVTLSFFPDVPFPMTLSGEIATLAPFPSELRWDLIEDEDEKKVAQTHLDFFDPDYFAKKKKTSTKKYRQFLDKEPEPTLPHVDFVAHAYFGPLAIRPQFVRTIMTATGTEQHPGTPLRASAYFNLVPFTCSYDGYMAHVEPDKPALDDFAQETRRAWEKLFDAEYLAQHKGAIWYFTKYITPHQPGEPYFFVKPPALMVTPPGYSTLIEGIPGPGYSILRGVVATDVFHALPAVFRIDQPLHRIEIPLTAPLTRFYHFPRTLMDATFRVVDWSHAPRLRDTP